VDRTPFRSPRWLALALALLAGIVYANSLAGEFAFDDNGIIVQNVALHDIGNLPRLLVAPYWPGLAAESALYRPVAIASFAVDWWLWGGNALGFHLVNVLAHITVTLLVFAFLLRLNAPVVAAAIGGALFAVHPVHTEAVANIVGRSEILAAGLVLAGCLVFLRRELRPSIRIATIAACYALALGSKESAVVLPALLLLLGWLHPDCGEALIDVIRREWKLLAALCVVLSAYLALRYSVLGVFGGSLPAPFMRDVSTGDRIATAVRVWPEYVRLIVFPKNLSADYSPGVLMPTTWTDPRVWFALPLGAATIVGAIRMRRKSPWGALAVLWFAIAILPVANLLFPVGVMLAERTLYLPSVAVAFAVPAIHPWYRGLGLAERRTLIGVAAGILLFGAVRTWTRNPAWGSTRAVFATLARERPESYRGIWFAADMEIQRGNAADGLAMYRHAFELMPHAQQLGSTYAYELLRHGRPAEAEGVVRTIFNPGFLPNHTVLIESLIALRRYEEAEKELSIAKRYLPRAQELKTLERHLAERRAITDKTRRPGAAR
jgi:hypothetical protein